MPGISPDIICHRLSIDPKTKLVRQKRRSYDAERYEAMKRMCVDYTDLNKGCLNDSFPLPLIDRLIDSTVGCELLSFMDAYLGYNQILMNPPRTILL
ncbi:hypothetical protein ACFX1X_006995 [Malus domestica]